MSVSGTATSNVAFAALSEKGFISLWDTRLKNKCYTTISSQRLTERRAEEDSSELLYLPEQHRAVRLWGSALHVVDTRKTMDVLSTYHHTAELTSFMANFPCSAATTALPVIDESGAVLSIGLSDGAPCAAMPTELFGVPMAVADARRGFGALSNLCCGFGAVGGPQRTVFTLAMDAQGALYGPDGAARPFTLEEEMSATNGMVVNPALPTCCAFQRAPSSRVAVGRANGVYDVVDVEADGAVVTQLSAPGHAVNGLCHLSWSPAGLLTVSLCGELTAWDVEGFLAEDEDEQEAGALPAVKAALSHRGVTGSAHAVMNCGTQLGDTSRYILGDSNGVVALCTVDTA
ncbi:hypothetical protein STCU_04658 [Strigomonas culicis]|uniref:Guanine nucleotide-binding protein subunit beta-like protein n=1 Tax=Strigomonas culicis TaxID=28005 RepID=S9UJW9_9TRYP|nr:hypothetical protein STCU_04658 [Strigomonas culicis]|eukprot:EPY29233.1 hypothetical protein STCU_04658 [Strigomonas culicis]